MNSFYRFDLRKPDVFAIKIPRSFELRTDPVDVVLIQGKPINQFVMPTTRFSCLLSRCANLIPGLGAVQSFILLAGLSLTVVPASKAAARTVPSASGQSPQFYSLPLNFEQNAGQVDESFQFLSRGPGYGSFLKPTEAVLSLQPKKSGRKTEKHESVPAEVLSMKVIGANERAMPTGVDKLPGSVNYITGSDA